MTAPISFTYLPRPNGNGPLDQVPLLPARLSRGGVSLDVVGLIDTGSSFNVLPFDVGAQFGIPWPSLPQPLALSGAAGPTPAKALALDVVIGSFAPVSLLFAWASTNDYPVLFGQANFFMEFDICFFRSRGEFQIQPQTP